jgi:hypothetical protein
MTRLRQTDEAGLGQAVALELDAAPKNTAACEIVEEPRRAADASRSDPTTWHGHAAKCDSVRRGWTPRPSRRGIRFHYAGPFVPAG